MITVSASELKAKCLAILDDVSRTGEPVIVTKRGRPVARLVPAGSDRGAMGLAGTVAIVGDIMSPAVPADLWEAESGAAR